MNNLVGSLVDFNIAQSSSSDMSNIKWTKKSPADKKPKSKKKAKIPPSNIVYTDTNADSSLKRIFVVRDSDKSKNKPKKISKKAQKAPASNCTIQHGFKRPGR